VEKVLAGSIRREMARDEQCARQAAQIQQLNRLVSFFSPLRNNKLITAPSPPNHSDIPGATI
jgi:kinesin family protein 15